MAQSGWTRGEVEAIVDDYFSMLALELAGLPYNKAAHRRALRLRLEDRNEPSIEFKHCNISAALLDAGFPYIAGYKPRSNYQTILAEVVAEKMSSASKLQELAQADVDRPMVVPEVEDILAILSDRPSPAAMAAKTREPVVAPIRLPINYLEREARNRSLGLAGEIFVINYERARLIHAGRETLAGKVEHTSRVRGDYEGYDVLSYDAHGEEQLIEVKTTRYGASTPFYVTRNEVTTSERRSAAYHIYRLYDFRSAPRLYTLPGAIGRSCRLSAVSFLATPA